MAMENADNPRPAAHSSIAASCNAPNELERVSICELRAAAPTAQSAIEFVDGATPQKLLNAVAEQHMHLLRVLAMVHSMSTSFADAAEAPAPEICAAFALLEQAIQLVAAGLEERSLRNAM